MIPKVIHYCWFGDNEIPEKEQKCINSWKVFCPDYKIIEWNEKNYDIEKILTEHKNGSEPISEEFYKLLNSDVKYILVPNLGGITRDSKQFEILLKSNEYNKIFSLDGSCGNNKKDFFNIVEPI